MSIYADIDREVNSRIKKVADDNGWVVDQVLSEHTDEEIEMFWRLFDIHCEMITEGWSQKVTKEVDDEVVRRYHLTKAA